MKDEIAERFGLPKLPLSDEEKVAVSLALAVKKCEKTANFDSDEDITYYDCGWDTDRPGIPHESYHRG